MDMTKPLSGSEREPSHSFEYEAPEEPEYSAADGTDNELTCDDAGCVNDGLGCASAACVTTAVAAGATRSGGATVTVPSDGTRGGGQHDGTPPEPEEPTERGGDCSRHASFCEPGKPLCDNGRGETDTSGQGNEDG
jgi:hypothetical protein